MKSQQLLACSFSCCCSYNRNSPHCPGGCPVQSRTSSESEVAMKQLTCLEGLFYCISGCLCLQFPCSGRSDAGQGRAGGGGMFSSGFINLGCPWAGAKARPLGSGAGQGAQGSARVPPRALAAIGSAEIHRQGKQPFTF